MAFARCFSQGDSVEEVIENFKEAIQVYLESLAEDELRTLPKVKVFVGLAI